MNEMKELAARPISLVETPVAHDPNLWCRILRLEEKCRRYEERLARIARIAALAEKETVTK